MEMTLTGNSNVVFADRQQVKVTKNIPLEPWINRKLDRWWKEKPFRYKLLMVFLLIKPTINPFYLFLNMWVLWSSLLSSFLFMGFCCVESEARNPWNCTSMELIFINHTMILKWLHLRVIWCSCFDVRGLSCSVQTPDNNGFSVKVQVR